MMPSSPAFDQHARDLSMTRALAILNGLAVARARQAS
jgi:hypothetical protein